jgi:hypothetical protein
MSETFLDYNLIPNLFEYIISSNSTSEPYENAFKYGIQSSVLLINAGRIILILISCIILAIFLSIICKIFDSFEKLKDLKIRTEYNFLIRYWIQGYIELGIFSIIQLKSVKFT